MPRPSTWAALAAAALAVAVAPAAAQEPAPAPEGPLRLESLRLPRTVSAQQGHARFLVGVRLTAPARLTVQLLSTDDGAVVSTVSEQRTRQPGRAYLRIDAVDSRGFQLTPGRYRLRVQAADDQGRVAPALQRAFQLTLNPPRGRFDAVTVPVWRAFQRQAGTRRPGQLVAVVAPRGAAARAGVRRGDVVTSLDGRPVGQPGAFTAATRAFLANRDVRVSLVRAGRTLTVTMRTRPDWRPVADYAPSLRVARRRAPKVIAYAVAQARHLVEAGEPADARRLVSAWPASWRTSAPGQLVQAEILAKEGRWKPALGAYNRARARDRTIAAAEFGRGIALSRLGRTGPSVVAFRAAARIDPTDSAAAAFLAYALLREDRVPEAVAAGRAAVALDTRYADAFLPLGIALLTAGERAEGIRFLRRGLILLDDSARAARLIARHLDPADP